MKKTPISTYVIVLSQGDYDEHRTSNIRAFLSMEDATVFKDRLESLFDRLKKSYHQMIDDYNFLNDDCISDTDFYLKYSWKMKINKYDGIIVIIEEVPLF